MKFNSISLKRLRNIPTFALELEKKIFLWRLSFVFFLFSKTKMMKARKSSFFQMFCSCWFRKSSFTVDSAAARRSRPRRIVAVAEITVGRTVDSTGTEKGKVKRASFVPICVSWVCLAPILFSFHIKSIFAYLSGAKFRTLL